LATFDATKKMDTSTFKLGNCIRRIVHYVRRPITWLKTFKTQKKIASFLYGKTGLKFSTW
jgi:hypothetical protein